MNNIIPEEIWKDIDGYEGLYKVSNKGRVYSHISNKVLKRYCSSNGYEHVNLTKNNNSRYLITHRLVAEAFVENEQNYPCVNHKDEDIRNNSADNLEWCTYQYNSYYGTRIDRITSLIDYKEVGRKNSKSILQFNLDGSFVKRWDSITNCKGETGYDKSNIVKCCRGKIKSAYGYVWRYEESS